MIAQTRTTITRKRAIVQKKRLRSGSSPGNRGTRALSWRIVTYSSMVKFSILPSEARSGRGGIESGISSILSRTLPIEAGLEGIPVTPDKPTRLENKRETSLSNAGVDKIHFPPVIYCPRRKKNYFRFSRITAQPRFGKALPVSPRRLSPHPRREPNDPNDHSLDRRRIPFFPDFGRTSPTAN